MFLGETLADEFKQPLGVVTCLVTMKGADGEWHTYQNIKVIRKQGEVWQCVYWQVTEAPL